MAQQRRRTHDPAIRMVVVYMPRSQQAVWSILGQTTRYLAHLASKTGQGTEDGFKQDPPTREGYGYPTLEQLSRAQEYTRRMRERGELRSCSEREGT